MLPIMGWSIILKNGGLLYDFEQSFTQKTKSSFQKNGQWHKQLQQSIQMLQYNQEDLR